MTKRTDKEYVCPYCSATVRSPLRRGHMSAYHSSIKRQDRINMSKWEKEKEAENNTLDSHNPH